VLQLLNVDGDDDATFHGQTLECELPPPKSDSYFNLYDDEQEMPLGGSAHSLRNLLVSSGGRDSPKSPAEQRLAPDAMYSPIGHASTNAVIQRLSDAHGNKDDDVYFSQKTADKDAMQTHISDATVLPSDAKYPISDATILPSDAKYPTAQALAPDNFGASMLHVGGRRLGRLSPTKAKDTAPTRTALPPDESDVLEIGDVSISSNVRRPMSFVKALELSDRLAVGEEAQRKRYGAGPLHDAPVPEVDEEREDSEVAEKDSKRKFGSSYEISV